MTKERLLKIKKEKKSKNPTFQRQDSYKKKRLSKSGWRRPRGWDSKQRKRMQRQAIVEPGYGTPVSLKGMDKTGLLIVRIEKLSDIKNLDPKKDTALISSKVGLKNKLLIIKELSEKKIKIQSIKDPSAYLKQKEEELEKKKQDKKKEVKKEPVPEKKEKKESIDEKLSDEDKKKLEKKEIDKLLTKKGQ